MAGLPEVAQWEPMVYQIETTDFASGGPSGHPNTSLRQLNNRAVWLKQRLEAMAETVVMHDDDGVAHHMVFVPRVRIAAESLGVGTPSRELRLGGFLVDKYPCVKREYIGGALKAVSEPMRAPWTGMSLDEAVSAAATRNIGGRPARLMTLDDWGQLDWINRAVGHALRGNLSDGRDTRDANEWESFGEPGRGSSLAGAGPASWFHNGRYDGIADLLGNVRHLVGESGAWYGSRYMYNAGCLQVARPATLVNAIDDVEESFEINDPAGYYWPKRGFDDWPETNGLLLLHAGAGGVEYVIYGSLVINPSMPWRATVTDCLRGQFGFGPNPYDAGASCGHVRYHHLVPGSYVVEAAGAIANEAGPSVVNTRSGRYAYGTRDATPAIGDVLCCGEEDLLVEGVSGTLLTLARGHNGTTIALHAEGSLLVKYSTTMNRVSQGLQMGYASGAVRTHADLEVLRLPAATTTGGGGLVPDRVEFNLRSEVGYEAFRRGGSIGHPGGLMSITSPHYDAFWNGCGMRCVVRLSDYQYGGQ